MGLVRCAGVRFTGLTRSLLWMFHQVFARSAIERWLAAVARVTSARSRAQKPAETPSEGLSVKPVEGSMN
jgi:hypothetical protein